VASNIRFTQLHKVWLDRHISSRRGERRRKLVAGHAHAERAMLEHVWYPAFGHFEYLHPEYEVRDYFDGRRYFDFAYIRGGLRIAIEVDPFGTHYEKLDKRQYSNQWVRQMHQFIDGWLFVRLSLDDVNERPRLWQQLFQQLIGRIYGGNVHDYSLSAEERDIIRLALRLDRPINLSDVKALLNCGYHKARMNLSTLEEKQRLTPFGNGDKRIHAWELNTAIPVPPL
jgi:hypothetical protein